MRKPLRLLLVADCENGASLVNADLLRVDWPAEIVQVSDAAGLTEQLGTPSRWDAVLADDACTLGSYKTLVMVRRVSEDVPVVVVRQARDENRYVDTVPPGDDPAATRLVRALERALQETELRKDRHQLREQLVIAERLASVGFLVAGVAHEINNPLSAVIANHEFLAGELMRLAGMGIDVSDAVSALRDASDGSAVIRQVVRDLRSFSRNDPSEDISTIDPRPVIESALRMTWHEIRGRARLKREIGETPLLHANEARLSQVFLNLLINAAHAIPPENAAANVIRVVARTDAEGSFVAEIHDTGSGIAPEHLPFIFDAYFTTKPEGRGTGLGLAVSHRIIERLGGKMTVVSELGVGTCFTVVVPPAGPSGTRR